MKKLLFICCLSSLSLFASEEEAVQRINAHLLLHNTHGAVQEAQKFALAYPDSQEVQIAHIRALSEHGYETEALENYFRFVEKFEKDKHNRNLLEIISWGILQKAKRSSQLSLSATALLGASFTSDARAVPFLVEQMNDSNAYLRAVAVKLSSMLGDHPLRNELLRLLQEEKVWYVRLEVINAIGHLQLKKAKPYLQDLIANPKTLMEERAQAIIALASMYEKLEKEEIEKFFKSNRAGLRELGCQLVSHFNAKEYLSRVIALCKDSSSDVRICALNSLGLMQLDESEQLSTWGNIKNTLQDHDPKVSITASWLACTWKQEEGLVKLEKWLENTDVDLRRAASGALAITGKFGYKLASRTMQASQDPYIRATLAISLMSQRREIAKASDTLYNIFLKEKQTPWMWDNSLNPLFRCLSPSRVRHIEQIPNYPLVVDQMVRLEILSILSIMNYPKAQMAVREFLQVQTWGVTSLAASTLLSEGDEEAFGLIKNLLQDKDDNIRIQAALMLAMVGGDFSSLHVLQEAYPNVDREMKIHILEAIAHIKDPSAIPFLIQIMSEPFQMLRIVAASALIQCLNH